MRAQCLAGRRYCCARNAVVVLAILGGCGRVGVYLLPLPAAETADLPDGGVPDGGACVGASCAPPMCVDPSSSPTAGVCGCGVDEITDSDADGVPDCSDFCPGSADQRDATSCGCPAADADADQDGVRNCLDHCPFDSAKAEPGSCGCGESDQDTDLDGTADCMDRCSGRSGAVYTPDATCGMGYCRTNNAPSTCLQGVETPCIAGPKVANDDVSCDGVDTDCDGRSDEDFVSVATTCGRGVCVATGFTGCVAGEVVDDCSAPAPSSSMDASCNGRDDDCDGKVDENVAPTVSTCAMGACAATGMIACVGGTLVDSCQSTVPLTPTDPTCDNIDDDCDSRIDEEYVASATGCGVGVCARSGMRTCVFGNAVDSCMAGTRTSTSDSVCNSLDDDCDGRIDEGFVATASSCGTGACVASGSVTCVSGAPQDSCVAKTPATTVDDATSPGNGIDDDCDGQIDENVPACDTTPRAYEAGAYNRITVPGACQHVSIRLWGGGGASGQTVSAIMGGDGGAGGYATANVLVSGAIDLYVGGGAASGCSGAGINAGSSTFNGGDGGPGTGSDGADGSAAGGGSGGAPSAGEKGGDGHYGGGGGGEAANATAGSGDGGGGGAASVFIVNGVRAALAGGGGGGGGALSILSGLVTGAGGDGGSGCRGNGLVGMPNGGGGGGGGACLGMSTQSGSGTTPAFSSDTPSGRARGGSGSCVAGGPGYAILTFSP